MDDRSVLRRRVLRRGTRRTNRLVTGRLSSALVLAALGPMVGAVFATTTSAQATQIVGAGLLGTVALIGLGVPLLGYQLLRYRLTGYRDEDWFADHDDSSPEVLGLRLSCHKVPAPFADIAPVECRVKTPQGEWVVISDDEFRIMRFRELFYWFHADNALVPGKIYEVRWYGTDRGQLVEITRETFRLKVHPEAPSAACA